MKKGRDNGEGINTSCKRNRRQRHCRRTGQTEGGRNGGSLGKRQDFGLNKEFTWTKNPRVMTWTIKKIIPIPERCNRSQQRKVSTKSLELKRVYALVQMFWEGDSHSRNSESWCYQKKVERSMNLESMKESGDLKKV